MLALDDIQRIQEPAIYELLDELLRHPPQTMHLVLIGRHDPALPITSLRARGMVTEIRAQDLRFPPQETAGLLNKMLDRQVDQTVAADWARMTEGWVTALRLAVLSLRHRGRADTAADVPLNGVILSMEGVIFIDAEGADMLKKIAQSGLDHGIDLHLTSIKSQVNEILQRDGVIDIVGADHIHDSVPAAVAMHLQKHPSDRVDFQGLLDLLHQAKSKGSDENV
jgi:anti-anti-sigma regulatory factor